MTSVEIMVSCTISSLALGNPVALVKMRNRVPNLVSSNPTTKERYLIVCYLNLTSWAHRTGENEKRNHKTCRSKRRVPVV